MTTVLKIVLVLIVLAALVVYAARRFERYTMYVPDPEWETPEQAGLAGIETVTLQAPDGAQLVAWYAPAEPGRHTLLYFHGNAGNLASRAERIRLYRSRGQGVFMMAYRGYNGSSGQPSERNNVADGVRAYDALTGRGVTAETIVAYGESLGSGVAVQVATRRPVAGLIMDAPYTSTVDMARLLFPYLPSGLLMADRYENSRHIRAVTVPVIVIHGARDEVIPVEMGRAVFAAANEPKRMVELATAGHTDHHAHGAFEAIQAWLAGLGKR